VVLKEVEVEGRRDQVAVEAALELGLEQIPAMVLEQAVLVVVALETVVLLVALEVH
jgi:hypothetical protein